MGSTSFRREGVARLLLNGLTQLDGFLVFNQELALSQWLDLPALDGVAVALLRLEDLELDLMRRRATRGGLRLELTAKEFTLLTLLLRRQGEVLSRTVLAEQVWDMNFDSNTNVVEVAVRRLRGKLDDPFDRKLLHTVRGMGYVLESREE